MGECYDLALLPSVICLGRFHILVASIYSNPDNSSVVRVLDFYPGGPGSNPMVGGKFFQLCFIPVLQLSCCKNKRHKYSWPSYSKLTMSLVNLSLKL